MKSRFKSDGDIQLWVVSRKDWAVPIFAEPLLFDDGRKRWRCRPAVNLLSATWEKFNPVMKDASERIHEGWYYIDYDSLPLVALKADGVTPEYYHRPIGQLEPDRESPGEVDGDYLSDSERLLRSVFRDTQLTTWTNMKLIWRVLCNQVARRLAEENRIVDLGFIRLVPLPYRPNWKSIMLSAFPRAAYGFRKFRISSRLRDYLLGIGFLHNLINSILLSVDRKKHTIRWIVEAIPSPELNSAFDQVELRRMNKLEKPGYAEHVRKSIVGRRKEALEAIRYWIDQTSEPCGAVDDGGALGGKILLPWVPEGHVLPAAPADGDTPVVVCADDDQIRGQITEGSRRAKTETVPEMPSLPPPAPQLWLGRRPEDMAQSSDKNG